MRKIVAMAIMIVIMIPILCVLSVNDTKAENVKAEVGSGEFVETSLYFYYNESESDYRMNTTLPPSGDANTSSLEDEESVEFKSPKLREDLIVNASKCCNITFYIEIKLNYPAVLDSIVVDLNFSLTNSNLHATGEDSIGETGDMEEWRTVSLDVEEEGETELNEDSDISLTISSSVFPHGENKKYLYEITLYYGSSDRDSHLSFYSSPVTLDNIITYDYNEEKCSEFKPNVLPPKSEIIFKGGIKDAFGDEENGTLEEVTMDIENPNGNIVDSVDLEAKTGDYECSWDYSGVSSSLIPGEYTAILNVVTHQHTFYRTRNFNFSAYGLEAKIDDDPSKASETILASSQADYTISMRNTGASKADVRVTLTIFVVTPGGLHEWNISLDGKSKEVNTTTATSVNPANLSYPDFELSGGSPKSLTLTAESLGPEDVGENWYCMVDVKVEFVGHSEIGPETLSATTYLAPPYKISLDWVETPDDPYYALVDVSTTLYVKATNMGTMPDTVNLSFSYTNHDDWDITLEPQIVNLSSFHQTGYYNSGIKLTVKPSSGTGEDTAFVNITAYSKGFWEGHNETLTRKYLTLNLSRAFGISSFNPVSPNIESVDVKVGDGQATYTLKLETNDNTTHTVKLTAVPDNENITTTIPESVDVSKDSPKNVTLTVTCPQGMLAGDYYIMITASITQNDIVVSGHSETVNVTVTVNPYNLLSIKWADTNKDEITVTGKPGEYVNKKLTVKNEGNIKIDNVNIMPSEGGDKSGLFNSVTPSQPSLLPGE